MMPSQHVRAQPEAPATDLDAWLQGLEAYLTRYVVFPSSHEAAMGSLWVVHTHNVDLYEVSPLAIISSAEMRSGKSRLLDCFELLVANPYDAKQQDRGSRRHPVVRAAWRCASTRAT